ncbi:hypothetical protein FF36_01909 [Frankia torreyi]|uniref:Uncharacterized protein n=1 Tax=Frankia torreyi TaxID=1856 RepID=A0A0D8BIB3_9ACTN|nr:MULTISPECIES: hypothetical protein [Frankia]KJE23724.1 hypothetical protein FF36_01909 [Frankia torreyi]
MSPTDLFAHHPDLIDVGSRYPLARAAMTLQERINAEGAGRFDPTRSPAEQREAWQRALGMCQARDVIPDVFEGRPQALADGLLALRAKADDPTLLDDERQDFDWQSDGYADALLTFDAAVRPLLGSTATSTEEAR